MYGYFILMLKKSRTKIFYLECVPIELNFFLNQVFFLKNSCGPSHLILEIVTCLFLVEKRLVMKVVWGCVFFYHLKWKLDVIHTLDEVNSR